MAEVLAPYEQHGLLEKLPQEPTEGNQQEIVVVPKGHPDQRQVVKVSDVLIGEADWLKKGLAERLESPECGHARFHLVAPPVAATLTLNATDNPPGQETGRRRGRAAVYARFARRRAGPGR